jgi:hypothetical protein
MQPATCCARAGRHHDGGRPEADKARCSDHLAESSHRLPPHASERVVHCQGWGLHTLPRHIVECLYRVRSLHSLRSLRSLALSRCARGNHPPVLRRERSVGGANGLGRVGGLLMMMMMCFVSGRGRGWCRIHGGRRLSGENLRKRRAAACLELSLGGALQGEGQGFGLQAVRWRAAERRHCTGREGTGSPTLQTLQEPILLPPLLSSFPNPGVICTWTIMGSVSVR